MIAYGFKTAFGPQIDTDAKEPKVLTLRRQRKAPSRHANVGETIGLWTGLRTKQAARRGVGVVILRGLLRFNAAGIVFVSELRSTLTVDAMADALEREILDAENDSFARRDGFENWAAMWAWHDAARDKEERGAPSLVRQIIAWRPLSKDQIAAVAAGARLEEVA
ncbi:MAG TPA: hypothetical protein VEA80_06745 [Vitreimonas sp.]|uniref:hypothetical protein n=1 Tax=Vitreimonas sp. TaxID=3069702 RepID=UPI002D5BDD5B|nr:hypothetical protein [Vitreimonas sp.]HYD87152.1 hypothetical protein [Vitreimonas sp.]